MHYKNTGQRPTDGFSFQLGDCEFGWVDCRIHRSIGGFTEEVEIRCSAVFDPFPDLFFFLEALVRGVHEAAWVVNQEGYYARLRAVRERENVLVRLETTGDELLDARWRELMQLRIPMTRFVEGIYYEWRAFVQSRRFDPKHWSVATRLDYWRHRTKRWPETGPHPVVEISPWCRDDVLAALFWAYPSFLEGQPETPSVPANWNDLSLDERKIVLTALLAEPVEGDASHDPRLINSPVVENWLRLKAPTC